MGDFVINFQHILHINLVFQLLTLNDVTAGFPFSPYVYSRNVLL